MDRLQLFSSLAAMAAVDGKISPEELAMLVDRAELWGISNEDAESVMVGLGEGVTELVLPESHRERVVMLQEMIRMMASDGELNEAEKRLCASVSAAMEFTGQEFNQILDELLGS
ncbi:MAG: hypothetical protein R3B96_00250 [Pirellulaceae bacterium]|nr:TerB family tellurite resistance protein [Planctomycetales bacterium]